MGKRKLGGRYELGRTLGVGAFGKVKCATNLKTGEKVAIKILNRADIKKHGLINSVRTEVTALQLIPKHKHIVNLIEVLESKLTLYLVLELVSGGELFDKIKLEGKLNEDVARHYYRQLISALEFMHERKICHRDLKLENLLVDQDGVLKVTDFGLSGLHTGSGDQVFKTTLGSPNYVAPEVLIGRGYDGFKADIWSSGVILYVLLAGFLPFDEDNANELFKKICTGDFRFPQTFSNDVIDLLNNVLVVDPVKRYTLHDIKTHSWFQSQKAEDAYYDYKPNDDELIISANDVLPTQIETPRSSHKFSQSSKRQKKFSEDSQSADYQNDDDIHPSLAYHNKHHSLPVHRHKSADDSHASPEDYYDEEKKEVHKSKSQKLRDPNISNNSKDRPGLPKRRSLQIRLEKYDPNNSNNSNEDEAKYDDVMKQYPEQRSTDNNHSNNATHSHSGSAGGNVLAVDNQSDISDYQTSDIDSSPSLSPRNMQPISMTAFDLIGIVSTQMLNNVFTRSLQDTSSQIKTYTRFVSKSTPPKILYAIQEAVHRIADCTCRVASDRYEIKVIKRKAHRTIHINIQIFATPVSNEYMIECRRTQGNIFKYHEFFEEFEKQYKNVIQHHKSPNNEASITASPVTAGRNTSMSLSPSKKKGKQIKFRNLDAEHSKHSRSVSENAVFSNSNSAKLFSSASNNSTANDLAALGKMQELNHAESQPSHRKGNASKSSASSNTSVPSHHSSMSSVSEQRENLNASASPTPTHQHNTSFSIEELHHSDSSNFDESADIHHEHELNVKQAVNSKRHRRSSSGQGKTYGVTKTGHLDIPSKVPENSK
mmetsp:Transcript_43746/g.70130  ORF Transcript_43746/g.70130 Transcript_43746/m.70130 type:complete len:824 (-) Transcript_43746:425-2896(-)